MAEQETSLVTGATGFIGRHLCRRLKDEGERVIALGRKTVDGPWDNFVEVDLGGGQLPFGIFEGVRTIYHLAGPAHAVCGKPAKDDSFHAVIVEGTRQLLEAAGSAGVHGFVYVSSVKAMGEGNPTGMPLNPIDENRPIHPVGPYGVAKAQAEALVRETSLPHAVILRPALVYGPGERGNIPRMIEAVRRGRFPPLPETGNRRSLIHVSDLVEFVIRASRSPRAAGRTYILASPEAPSTRELYDMIRQALSLPARKWAVPGLFLKGAALAGTVAEAITGREMSLNLATLGKLTGFAWYSAALAETELGYAARRRLMDWLDEGY